MSEEENPEEEPQVEFLPFHAINEFMRDDYRLSVIRHTLQALPNLPADFRSPLEDHIRQVVRVPGFRNGLKAPLLLKIKPVADAFEKSPELVATLLSAWSESQSELRVKIHDMLQGRGWEILPLETNRAVLPGFLTVWPKDQDFEVLNQAFEELYPGTEASSDDISLMIVWLSGRLPYHVEGEEEESTEEDQ